MSRFRVLGVLGALAVVLSLLVVAPGASHAATGSAADKKGDAPKAIDITSLKVANSQKTIKATIKIKDLGKKGLFTTVWLRPDLTGSSYGVNLQKKSGKTKATMVRIKDGKATTVKCAGLKATWNASTNVLGFTVPQKCNGKGIPASWIFSTSSFLGGGVDSLDSNLEVQRG